MLQQNINNKIAILITWPREVDIFNELIFPIDKRIVLIVDNFDYSEADRKGNFKKITGLLKSKGCEYVLLSDAISSIKYKIIISTGLAYLEKITVKSFLKYLYALTIGNLFEFIGIDVFLTTLIGRPLTAGGKNAVNYEMRTIERRIGKRVYHFPKGLDIGSKSYPESFLLQTFDIFLCHGNIDKKLIKKKSPESNCIIVGYPKYHNLPSKKNPSSLVYKDIGLNPTSRKVVLWVPTYNKMPSEELLNIETWAHVLAKLTDEYNVIVRPHPKTLVVYPEISKKLSSLGFYIDKNTDRRMVELYMTADIVLADYGSSVFSAIYMEKKLILLNLPDTSKYLYKAINGGYLDEEVRNDIASVSPHNVEELPALILEMINTNNDKIKEIKSKYFSDIDAIKTIEQLKKDMFNYLK
jgi:hypothetical protein